MRTVYIYTISCPITGEVRYVGKTVNPKKRFNNHIFPDNDYYISRWTKKLISQGLKPVFHIIDEVDEDNWEFWEQHYICLYKSWGFKLTNCTIGGEGNHGRAAWNKGKKGIYSENTLDKMRGRNFKGEKNPCSKLTSGQVREIRKRVAAGEKQKFLAPEYGVNAQTINKIIKGRTYKEVL